MSSELPDVRANRDVGETDHHFLPDFIWAAVGGIVLLTASTLFLFFAFSMGGVSRGAPMPGGGADSVSMYYRELAGLFLAGFLVILVARSLTVRTR